MSNYDIHEMMDRAHFAEIREQRLRIEVDRLEAENARLRADAERFIWLADRMARYAALVEVNPSDDNASDKNWFHIEQGEDLRVAIDAALSPQETPK